LISFPKKQNAREKLNVELRAVEIMQHFLDFFSYLEWILETSRPYNKHLDHGKKHEDS
jgi:hypothetical protein